MKNLVFCSAHKAIYENDSVYAYFAYTNKNKDLVDHLNRKITESDGMEFLAHIEKKIRQKIAGGLLNTQYYVKDNAAMMEGSSFPALLISRIDRRDIDENDVATLKTLLPAIVLRHNAHRNELFSPSAAAPKAPPETEHKVLRSRRN